LANPAASNRRRVPTKGHGEVDSPALVVSRVPLDAWTLSVPIGAVLPLDRIAAAHDRVDAAGRVLLTLP
jgi:hypothetical protein